MLTFTWRSSPGAQISFRCGMGHPGSPAGPLQQDLQADWGRPPADHVVPGAVRPGANRRTPGHPRIRSGRLAAAVVAVVCGRGYVEDAQQAGAAEGHQRGRPALLEFACEVVSLAAIDQIGGSRG